MAQNEREELVRMLKQAGVSDGESEALDEQLLSTTQVAMVLRVTDRAVRSWAESGKIRSIRTLGGRWLFPASAVRAAIESMVGKTS